MHRRSSRHDLNIADESVLRSPSKRRGPRWATYLMQRIAWIRRSPVLDPPKRRSFIPLPVTAQHAPVSTVRPGLDYGELVYSCSSAVRFRVGAPKNADAKYGEERKYVNPSKRTALKRDGPNADDGPETLNACRDPKAYAASRGRAGTENTPRGDNPMRLIANASGTHVTILPGELRRAD